MAKRLMVKTGTYEKDGETKGRFTEVGVILSNDNGEFAILNPEINLAGLLMKQRINKISIGDNEGVICGIFEDR